jgi:hypothetical protein
MEMTQKVTRPECHITLVTLLPTLGLDAQRSQGKLSNDPEGEKPSDMLCGLEDHGPVMGTRV